MPQIILRRRPMLISLCVFLSLVAEGFQLDMCSPMLSSLSSQTFSSSSTSKPGWNHDVFLSFRASPITFTRPWFRPESTPSKTTTSLQEGRKSPLNYSNRFRNKDNPLWFSKKAMRLPIGALMSSCTFTARIPQATLFSPYFMM